MKVKESMHKIFTMPYIYAILLALLFKYLKVDVTTTHLWPTLKYIKDRLVSMELIILGAQLSKTEFDFRNTNVNMTVFTRLILGPINALVLIHLFDFTGVVGQTVFYHIQFQLL